MVIEKDPDALLDYCMKWIRWLSGDEIATSMWIVPAGLTKEGEENTTTTATVWLSGGTAGEDYQITNRITTVGGRRQDRSVTIRLKQL